MTTTEFDNFYNRWIGKSEKYKDDSLENIFDRFITLFIIYNALYTEVAKELVTSGKIKTKDPKEKTKATQYVLQYLKSEFFLNSLLNDENSKNCLLKVCEIIKNKKFYVICEDVNGNLSKEDENLLSELKGNGTSKANAILMLLYSIRCNIFHSRKGFDNEQKELLMPLNHLLAKTIHIVYKKLSTP
jgi:hypothetical protein